MVHAQSCTRDYVTSIANSTQCAGAHGVSVDATSGVVYAACYGSGVVAINGSSVTPMANSTQ